MADKDLRELYKNVDSILSSVNVENIDPNAPDFDNLPDGYYLCEVQKLELCVSKKGNLQVKGQFKTIENGLKVVIDEDGDSKLEEITKTKDRMIFKYWTLSEKKDVEKFIKDMLKFEGDEPGVPLLEKEYFSNSELLEQALEVLQEMNIYAQISTSKNKEGESSSWTNLISWSRAASLGLIDE